MYGAPVWQLGEKGGLLYLPVKKHNFIFSVSNQSQLHLLYESAAGYICTYCVSYVVKNCLFGRKYVTD